MVWEKEAPHAGFSSVKPWLPVPAMHRALAVDQQETLPGSVLAHYRQTLAFRRKHAPLLDGSMTFLETNQDILAFTREKGGEKLLFVFNLRRGPQTVQLPEGIRVSRGCADAWFCAGSRRTARLTLEALDVFCGRL